MSGMTFKAFVAATLIVLQSLGGNYRGCQIKTLQKWSGDKNNSPKKSYIIKLRARVSRIMGWKVEPARALGVRGGMSVALVLLLSVSKSGAWVGALLRIGVPHAMRSALLCWSPKTLRAVPRRAQELYENLQQRAFATKPQSREKTTRWKEEMNDEQTEEPRWMKSLKSYISATPKVTLTTLTFRGPTFLPLVSNPLV